MKAPQAPQLDERRKEKFATELRERAQAWIPDWALADGERDFGRALLEIAARFSSEVAQHLDVAGDKMRRGFLDWLGIPRIAARPARLPIVFKLVDAATEAVLASAPVQMQTDAAGTPVVFETEQDVQVVPGQLEVVVGVDADQDAYYLPPPGLSDLQPAEPLPTQWQLKSFASAGANKLQLVPETGLSDEMIIDAGGVHYRIVQVENGIATIDPPLDAELPESTLVTAVTTFAPFDGVSRNRQEHVLYLGHMDLLNIEAAATIDVVGASALSTGVTWQYWGKVDGRDEVGWQPLKVAPPADQQPGALVLTKPKGAIEPKKIGEINSRWIRAYTKKVEGTAPQLHVDALKLRVNCKTDIPPCPQAAGQVEPSPEAEAMANTTPLVLDNAFYPFGKEPRQFDAFYLGSQEAFSKPAAKVQLCFQMAEPSFAALSCLRAGAPPKEFLAGVAGDGYLHLLQFDPTSGSLSPYPNREPLRPPSPGPAGNAVEGPPVALDPRPPFRAPIWTVGTNMCIAVSAKSAVWIWREDTGTPANSGWESAGLVEPVTNADAAIAALVYLADAPAGQLFALRDSTLFVRNLNDSNATWRVVKTQTPANNQVKLTAIAPILIQDLALREGNLSTGLVGVDGNKTLYGIQLQNTPLEGTCNKLLADVAPDVTPAAVRPAPPGGQLIAVAVGKEQSNRKLLAFRSTPSTVTEPSTFTEADHLEVDLQAVNLVGRSIDVNLTGGRPTFVACVKPNVEATALVAWSPFDPNPDAVLFTTTFPPYVDTPAGAPTLLPRHVIEPTISSQVLVAPFDVGPSGRLTLTTKLRTALVASDATEQLAVGDQVAIPVAAVLPTHKLETVAAGVEHGGKTAYEFDVQSLDDKVFVYPATPASFTVTVDPSKLDTLKIHSNDNKTTNLSILLITTDKSTDLYYVTAFDGTTKIATLDRNLDVTNPTVPPPTVSYKAPNSTTAELLPLMHLDPATNGNWNTTLLDRTRLVFPGADPELQIGTVFQADSTGKPILVVLSKQWSTAPPVVAGGDVKFIVDGSVGEWVAQLGNTFTNPELSWEYWNGKGWWKLHVTFDDTQNLKTTGAVQFEVPSDIASSDWAGKTNFWLRARLVGGDYGREKVTAKTKTLPDGSTEQTIERSSEGIRAPQVLELHISYAVCNEVPPTYVLAEDSGTIRDQSDANRTAGAIVEAFAPLALTLGRLSRAAAPLPAPGDCPPECDDQSRQTAAAQPPAGAVAVPASQPAGGRALFIGLAATLSEAPVNVLLLVDGREYAAFAPMSIEALVADHFAPIVADDTTRALGESGLLSMTFTIPPTRSELFGKENLTWLRLTPKANATSAWLPVLRGAYLNAVWASATETMTRELLGSSDGAPNMSVRLARPPVLDHTLKLRVKEPLGDEERAVLLKAGAAKVVRERQPLTGHWIDWVLWEQVVDPNDEHADARVYALDEATGEIRFGDGQHGRIPPIGRDAIVAFRYQRTELGPSGSATVPGNRIAARTTLNLVSPVATVESVTAADQAAGGAPPEDDDRVLRFGYARLRHRDRAVTLHDLEDLAVQSSPDIVQARAVARRDSIRLVVVMKGRDPVPTPAQVRALRRLLLASAPVSLSAPSALRIEGPEIRRLRIGLTLRVERLEYAGALGRYVTGRLVDFFNTATGGIDKDGWAMGISPSEGDIAFILIDAPHLDSIEEVTLTEILPDGSEKPWPDTLKPTELAMLHDDSLRIQFETAEVEQ